MGCSVLPQGEDPWNWILRPCSAQAGPLQLDLVESYAQGLSRREFLRRGDVIGLSVPFIGAIVSACGSDGEQARARRPAAPGRHGPAARAGKAGGTIKIASPDAGRRVDPGRHAGPRRLRDHRPVLRVPRDPRRGRRDRARAGRVVDPERRRQRVDVQASPGREVAGRLRLHVGRRRRHDGSPRRGRQLRPQGRDREGGGGHLGPQRRGDHPDRAQPELPVPRVGVQRAVADHPGRLRDRHHPRRIAERHRAVEAGQLRPTTGATFSRNPNWWGGAPALDGRRSSSSTTSERWSRRCRAAPSTRSCSSRRSAATGLLDNPDFTVLDIQASTHRQIWMRCDTGQFADKRVRQALALTFDREAMVDDVVPGQGRGRERSHHPPFARSSATRWPSARRTTRRPGSCSPHAGFPNGLKADLHAAELQEIPDLAQLIQSGAKARVSTCSSTIESPRHVLRGAVVPGRAGRPAVLRRRRARHRRLRPPTDARRLPERGVRHERRVELVAVLVTRSSTPRSRSSSRARARGPGRGVRQARDDHERGRAGGRAVLLQLPSGHSNAVQDVRVSALGQMFVENASFV